MSKPIDEAGRGRVHHAICWGAIAAGWLAAGCAPNGGKLDLDSPELAAYIQLVLPARIEIQPDWTKPVSLDESGNADALEVIFAAYDSLGDRTKLVGTLHFELHVRRMASADRLGRRIAFWPVELKTLDALTRYWDSPMRFHTFLLPLPEKPLPSGQYILVARLTTPGGQPPSAIGGQRLFDEYEFAYEAGSAPPARLKP